MAMCTTCVKVLPWLVGSKSTVVPAWDLLGALQDMILRCSRIGAGGGGLQCSCQVFWDVFLFFHKSPPPLFSVLYLQCISTIPRLFRKSTRPTHTIK